MKRKGQQTKTINGKRYKIRCGCGNNVTTTLYTIDSEKYELKLDLDVPYCEACRYYPWVRLGRLPK